MGDRRHVVLTYDDKVRGAQEIYLYSHWNGSELPKLVANALIKAKGRWSDETYCARIIVTSVVHQCDACEQETSWGLAPYFMDSEYNSDVVVFLTKQMIKLGEITLSYEDYIKTQGVVNANQ